MKRLYSGIPTLLLATVVALLATSTAFGTATIVIQNNDPAGAGFNDPTPATPIGGNPGTTVGQQRLNAFQFAADIWGATLTSGPTITVRASWASLTCTATSGTLGQAGAVSSFRNFPGAPFTNTWYSVALANALSNTDLNAGAEISAQFNSNLGNSGCLQNLHWYYGLNTSTDPGGINLVAVLLHEFAHGLGVQTITSASSGAQSSGFPSIYDRFLFDNTTGKTWVQMTDAERQASAINTNNLGWNGPQAMSDASLLTAGKDPSGRPLVYTPDPVEGGSSVSHWSTAATPNQLMEPNISSNLTHSVTPPQDLTFSLLRDIGWCSGCPQPSPTPTPSPTPSPSPPANDNFANAQIISGCSGSVSGTNVGATKESGEPSHSPDGDAGGGSVWYQWQAPSAGSVTITTEGSANDDTVLAVYTGNSVNALTAIVKNDDVDLGTIRTSSVTFNATSGTVYKIAVDGWNDERGAILLNWNLSGCPLPKSDQTITFPALPDKIYGDVPFSISATASSGLPVSFAILSGPATVSGNTITITAAGSVTVRASQAGNAAFNAATPVDRPFTVAKANQTITFNALSAKTFGDAPFTVSASSTSSLPVSFSILSGPATISGNTVTLTGAGTVTVRAAQAGDVNFNAAVPVDQSFTVNKANQTITFNALANKNFGDAPFTVNASASSNLLISFSIVSGPASISGSTITITGIGVVTVRASQAGDGNWNAATPVDRAFTVAKANQTITFNPLAGKTFGDTPFTVSANSTSSLPVSFSILSGPAIISGNTVTLNGAGTVTVRAAQAGDANFNAATPVDQSFVVNKANQTITFNALANKSFGDAPFSVSAIASSDLAVTFTIVSGPATISGSSISITGIGVVTVRASQTGNGNWNAATPVDRAFTVAKANQTITFNPLSGKTFGDAPFSISAGASSNLPVSFSILSGPAIISGNTVTLTGAGTVTVRAAQAGDANFNAATAVDQSFVVNKANQTITFNALANKSFGDAPFNVSAISTSDLAISFTIVSGPATISGDTITITGGGLITVRASQTGNANFNAATPVDQSFTAVAFSITGRIVKGSNSASLIGVDVTISGSSSGATTTNSGGLYSFTNLRKGGNYTITPSRPDYKFVPVSRVFTNLESDQPANFAGSPIYRVSGRIADAKGVGVANVNLVLGVQADPIPTGPVTTTTDANGNYDFGDLDYVDINFNFNVIFAVYPSKPGYSFGPILFRNVAGVDIAGISIGLITRDTPKTAVANFYPVNSISGRVTDSNGAVSGATLSLSGGGIATATSDVNGNYSFANLPAGSDYTITAAKPNQVFTPSNRTFTALGTNRTDANFSAQPFHAGFEPVVLTSDQVALNTWTVQGRTYAYVKLFFPNAGYGVVNWGHPERLVSDFSADAAVEKSTGASVLAVTTTAQIYDLGVIADGNYTFSFKNSGTVVKSLAFTVSSAPPPPNPIDNAREFVKQQYRDFLNREADQAGEDFWTDNITKCSDPARRSAGQTEAECTIRQRETTSGAFFLSPEFQYTGYYVYRMYLGALGRQPKLSEFTPDAQFVGNGILVNGQLSAAKINQNKAGFAAQFVDCNDATKYRCGEFKVIYDGLTNQGYVDRLFQNTGVNASVTDRTALVNGLNGGTESRASVLQKVVDGINVISEGNQQFTTTYGQAFYDQQLTRAFVQLEYFGYMKRDPDEAGYAFWLAKLNLFGGNFVNAEMVLAFISSPEYRARFGQP